MSAHTQGPWELRANDMGGVSALIYPAGSDMPVASVTGYFGSHGQTLPNARLIAAAPELLEALAAIINEAGPMYGNDDGPGSVNRMAYLARAAIAKATGSAA